MLEKLRPTKENLTLFSTILAGVVLAIPHTDLEIVKRYIQELFLGGFAIAVIFPLIAKESQAEEKNTPQE